ncbi:hypothetical protein BX600DRAFT_467289 [Xylariales sp. PMI_506]|nr:hypothetical protein BX600DRAFT_467289 [Xylariales sp. PMI_506]
MMKSTRASNPKSRTGCRTCKRRRVECDEAKPSCNRCISSDRLCEGYGIIISHARRSAPLDELSKLSTSLGVLIRPKPVQELRSIPFLDESESFTFELFRSQTVLELSGIRSKGFWRYSVLPACYLEPAILHSALALASAMRWHRDPRHRTGPDANTHIPLEIVKEYNKAIRFLKKNIDAHDNTASLRVALIACVLFIALEIRAGRLIKAAMHMNEGMKLLRKYLHSPTPAATAVFKHSSLNLPPIPHTIEDELVAVFVDLDLQVSCLTGEKPQLNLIADGSLRDICQPLQYMAMPLFLPTAPAIGSNEQAKQIITFITNKCLDFNSQKLRQKLETDYCTLRNEVRETYRNQILNSLRIWRDSYDRYYSTVDEAERLDQSWQRQSASMLVQHAWLSTMLPFDNFESDETQFDEHLNHFGSIVDLASLIVPENKVCVSRFSLEFGMVAPLWWTAMKCRHPRIRHKALQLLKNAGQDGIWDAILLSQLAGEAIQMEEETDIVDENTLMDARPTYSDLHWAELVPLQRRLTAAEVQFEDDNETSIITTFHRKIWNEKMEFIRTETIVRKRPYYAHAALG